MHNNDTKRKESEQGCENSCEKIMIKSDEDTPVQEVQSPKQMNSKRLTPRQIIKIAKIRDKQRLLKVAREK